MCVTAKHAVRFALHFGRVGSRLRASNSSQLGICVRDSVGHITTQEVVRSSDLAQIPEFGFDYRLRFWTAESPRIDDGIPTIEEGGARIALRSKSFILAHVVQPCTRAELNVV